MFYEFLLCLFQLTNKLTLANSKLELLKLSLEKRIQEVQSSSNSLSSKADLLRNELLAGAAGNGGGLGNGHGVMSPTRPSHYSIFKPAAVTGKLHVRWELAVCLSVCLSVFLFIYPLT